MPSPSDDPYGAIAEWYDVEHNTHTDDLECYLSLISGTHEGPARLLEVGSGTGRIQAALALAGHHVTGVEPSAAMRARADLRCASLPQRVARRIRTLAGSATRLPLADDETFNVALFGLNTFAHLLARDERLLALTLARRHLVPGGALILDLDLSGPQRLCAAAGHVLWQGTWPIEPTGSELSHFVAAMPDGSPGTLRVLHFYDVSAPGGGVHRTTAAMSLALLGHGEMELALEAAGFESVAVYGSHDLTGFEEGSARALYVARAP
jgi:SAM-dependent methyltransferase